MGFPAKEATTTKRESTIAAAEEEEKIGFTRDPHNIANSTYESAFLCQKNFYRMMLI